MSEYDSHHVQDNLAVAPPHAMHADDSSAAEPARRHLAQKSRRPFFSNLRSKLCSPCHRSSSPSPSTSNVDLDQVPLNLPPIVIEQVSDNDNNNSIILDGSGISPVLPDDKDIYKWAVMYENQRGLTVFSTPYYSPYSLFFFDPLPFTVPSSSSHRADQPNVSLRNYPLPDGTWRWVSNAWMIDMRTDSGEVQHDGFEYNWMFRPHSWRAEVGSLSTGAWVRRRRWVRLMMRPARNFKKNDIKHANEDSYIDYDYDNEEGREKSKSVLDQFLEEPNRVWKGDEKDWARCHTLLRRLGTDGVKLELWRAWLGPYVCDSASKTSIKGKEVAREPKPVEDEKATPPSPEHFDRSSRKKLNIKAPPLDHLSAVLRDHNDTILQGFMLPDSRARYLTLLHTAGLLGPSDVGRASYMTLSQVCFWSYASDLGGRRMEKEEEILRECRELKEKLKEEEAMGEEGKKTMEEIGKEAMRVVKKERWDDDMWTEAWETFGKEDKFVDAEEGGDEESEIKEKREGEDKISKTGGDILGAESKQEPGVEENSKASGYNVG